MSMQHLLSAVLAREFGCELSEKLKEQVKGRILREDVQSYVKRVN